MSGEAWLYLLAVLINAVNLFLQVFFTIMYSDLEWYVASRSEHFGSTFVMRLQARPIRFRHLRASTACSCRANATAGIVYANRTTVRQ